MNSPQHIAAAASLLFGATFVVAVLSALGQAQSVIYSGLIAAG